MAQFGLLLRVFVQRTQPFRGHCFYATPAGLPAYGENRLIG